MSSNVRFLTNIVFLRRYLLICFALAGHLYLHDSYAGASQKGFTDASPLFGVFSGLPPTTIFSGTREFFYQENLLLFNKFEDAKCNVRLEVGLDCSHIWPLFQFLGVRESEQAMQRLKIALQENIKGDSNSI